MQLRTLITVSAALAPQLVKTQNITRWLEQQAKLPPCAQSCLDTGYELSNISRTDIYGTCNDPTLLNYVGPCESAAGNCSYRDRQNIITRASADCAVVGGIASSVYTARFPGLPACANNCSSSGLRFSGCQANDTSCLCKSSLFLNAYGPCVQSVCNGSETADVVTFFEKGCAPFGGIGPFNASDIQGYLDFTGPNRTLFFYPPFYTPENATNAANTSGIHTSSVPVATFTGAAASTMMGHHGSWSLLGLIGAIILA